MPRVPTYDNFQVMPDRFQPVEARAQVPGVDPSRQMGDMGRALTAAGAKITEIEFEMQKDLDEARVKEADVALAEALRTIQHDPERGYLNTMGRTAIDQRASTTRSIRELEGALSKDLTPAQRDLFRQVALRRLQSALEQVDVHAARQTREYATGTAKARAEAQVPEMVTNWADPRRFAQARATGLAELDALAQTIGMDGEMKEAARREYLTGAHQQVLENIISLDRAQDARAYFERFQGEIDPTRHDAIRKALQQVGIKGDSLNLAMELGTKGENLAAQLKSLDSLYKNGKVSPDVYDATRQRVEHNWQLRKAQQGEYEKAVIGQAHDWVLRNPGASVLDMPSGLYANLKTTGHLDNIATFARTSGRPETDPETYYGLRRLAAEEPENFVNLNLLASRHLLAPGDWEELVKVQTSISKADAKAMAQQRVVGDTIKLMRSDILAAGIDLTPKEGSPQAKELATFMGSITRALDEAQRAKGGPLTPDEARRIGLGQLKEGWLQGSGVFWDDKTRRYAAEGEFVSMRYADIPAATRNEIEADLLAAGAKVTEDEVERIYQRALDAGRVE